MVLMPAQTLRIYRTPTHPSEAQILESKLPDTLSEAHKAFDSAVRYNSYQEALNAKSLYDEVFEILRAINPTPPFATQRGTDDELSLLEYAVGRISAAFSFDIKSFTRFKKCT